MSSGKKKLFIIIGVVFGGIVFWGTVILISLLALIKTHVICLKHEWEPATCTEPKSCIYCDKTEGTELGHVWLDATCTEASKCSGCNVSRGSANGHTWVDATCTEAQYCSVCAVSSGQPLGHTWLEATCLDPKTCSVCFTVEGFALGHNWIDATCTEAKTCTQCYETEGDPLGHSSHVEIDSYPVLGYYYERLVCSHCDECIKENKEYYTTLISGESFIFTCSQMMQRAENAMEDISGCYLTTGTKTVDNELYGCFWNITGEAVAIVSFLGVGEDNILQNSSACPRGVMVYAEDSDDFGYVLWGVIGACDPSLDFEEIRDVCTETLNASLTYDSYEKHGIRYVITSVSGGWFIGATVIAAVEGI